MFNVLFVANHLKPWSRRFSLSKWSAGGSVCGQEVSGDSCSVSMWKHVKSLRKLHGSTSTIPPCTTSCHRLDKSLSQACPPSARQAAVVAAGVHHRRLCPFPWVCYTDTTASSGRHSVKRDSLPQDGKWNIIHLVAIKNPTVPFIKLETKAVILITFQCGKLYCTYLNPPCELSEFSCWLPKPKSPATQRLLLHTAEGCFSKAVHCFLHIQHIKFFVEHLDACEWCYIYMQNDQSVTGKSCSMKRFQNRLVYSPHKSLSLEKKTKHSIYKLISWSGEEVNISLI